MKKSPTSSSTRSPVAIQAAEQSPFHDPACLRDRLLTLMEVQWAALGVPIADPGDNRFVVDPEALLLITTSQGRYRPRLFDTSLDWLWERGASINLQRLGNLAKGLRLGDERVFAAVATWLGRRGIHAPWRKLTLRVAKPDTTDGGQPFFLQRDGRPLPFSGPVDEVFIHYGWRRSPVEIRGLGLPPNPHDPRALLLKLRSLFGIQARCEVLLWLLTHESGHAAEIARATGYFPRTTEKCLREMADSGHVRTTRTGRQTRYWVDPGDWSFLRTWDRPDAFPEWRDWPRLFSLTERVLAVLDRNLSDRLLASELRRIFEELQPMLSQAGLLSSFTVTPAHLGQQFTDKFLSDLERLLS